MKQFVDRLNEPFQRGLFGRDIRLGQVALNTGSIAGTLIVTSALGFPFWWIAAHFFATDVVGLAAAAISGMQLLGGIAALGLGALLVREIPRHPGHERGLIRSGLIVAGTAGIVGGFAAAYLVSFVDEPLAPLSATPWNAAIFALGVSLTSLTIVADQSLIGLLRGEIQFIRNFVFAASKLLLLAIVGWVIGGGSWAAIYAVWSIGALLSLILVIGMAIVRLRVPTVTDAPAPSLRRLGSSAGGHFALNLALQLPVLGMPLLVTILGGAALNASFYLAWLIAAAASMIPFALSSTLYAVGSRAPDALPQQMRLTLGLSVAAATVGAIGLAIIGGPLLRILGGGYADAAGALVILAIASVPMVVKQHFHVLLRIRGQLTRATLICTAGGAVELTGAALGFVSGGLAGLAMGYLAGVAIEAIVMAIPIAQIAFPADRRHPA